MTGPDTLQVHDVAPVRSRVSWGALFAGAFVALTVYVLLSVLGAALGLSMADYYRGTSMTTMAGIWAAVSLLIALFCGGCVTTQFTAGETKTEAVIYGVILWGLMFAVILWMTGAIFQAGFAGILRGANVAASMDQRGVDWQRVARESGVSQEQIDRMRASLPSVAELHAGSTQAAWWLFATLLVSLLASIAGALVGSGPTPMLRTLLFRRAVVVQTGSREMHPSGA